MEFLRTAAISSLICRSGSGGSSGGSGGFTPGVTALTLTIDANTNPPINPVGQYAPLSVANSDGTPPTLTPGAFALASGSFASNIDAVVNAAVVANTGPSATASPPQPFGAVFVPVALGTATFQLFADGQLCWTYNITVVDDAPETFSSGAPVNLPAGSTVPASLDF